MGSRERPNRGNRVKITAVRLDHLRLPLDPPFAAAWDPVPRDRFDATVVSVDTDEGITGIGSGDTMRGFDAFAHLFVGEDPRAIGRHVRTLETISYHSSRFWPLEAALWDIIGQACGQPVYRLFGGVTDRIAAYASCGQRRTPSEQAEAVLAIRDEGFRAVKLRIDRDRVAEGLAAVRATRDAVGDDLAIMVDLNQGWRMPGDTTPAGDFPHARRIAAELAELDVTWIEEPLPEGNLDDLRALRHTTGMRIAGGEMIRTFAQLLDTIEADALDVYQPDVALAAGMSRTRTAAEVLLARNRWFTPHTWTNGLGLLANLHVAAGVGGGPFIEFPYDPPGWSLERRDFFLAEPVRVDSDGMVVAPDEPGLGAELDPAAVERFRIGTSA